MLLLASVAFLLFSQDIDVLHNKCKVTTVCDGDEHSRLHSLFASRSRTAALVTIEVHPFLPLPSPHRRSSPLSFSFSSHISCVVVSITVEFNILCISTIACLEDQLPLFSLPPILSLLFSPSYSLSPILSLLFSPSYSLPLILSLLFSPSYSLPPILSLLFSPSYSLPPILSLLLFFLYRPEHQTSYKPTSERTSSTSYYPSASPSQFYSAILPLLSLLSLSSPSLSSSSSSLLSLLLQFHTGSFNTPNGKLYSTCFREER